MIYEVEISKQAENDLRGIYEYIVLYIPDRKKKKVFIARVMYDGRDIRQQFTEKEST